MPKSLYLARATLNDLFRTTKYTPGSTIYFSLHSADPTKANITSTELTIGVGGYARAALAIADASWTAPATSGSDEMITNATLISFGTATATLNGGVAIPYWGCYDNSTGGNLLWFGAIGTPRVVNSGDPIQIPIGAMSFRES